MSVVAFPNQPAMPINLEAEKGVLGAILVNNDLYPAVCGFLRDDHFSEALNAEIYSAMGKRIAAGEKAKLLTIISDLPRNIEGFSIGEYVAHLAAEAWTASDDIVGAAKEIVRTAARRQLMELSTGMAEQARTNGIPAHDIISASETALISLGDELHSLGHRDGSEDPDHILEAVGERMRSGRHWKGATCGLTALDNRLGGFGPGELIIIGARPSMGKTMMALAIGRKAAALGHGVGIISLEMPKAQLWHRLLADECEVARHTIAYDRIGKGLISPEEFATVEKANARLKKLPLWISDHGDRLSDMPGHIRNARRWLEKRGSELSILIVDYLGLMKPGDRYAGNRVGEVTEISSTLKSLAKREKLPIIALHQLNRANETAGRSDFRPRLSDLRDSGALEQDADVVMFVHRDSYYIERGAIKFASEAEQAQAYLDAEHQLEILVSKNRQGTVGTSKLWCQMATNSVRDVAL